MRFSSIRYLMPGGLSQHLAEPFYGLASIGVLMSCLLITGGACLVFLNIDHAFDLIYDQNVVAVFVKEDQTDEQVQELGQQIQSITNVGTVTFISKEESLQNMRNPFPRPPLKACRERTIRCWIPLSFPLRIWRSSIPP